MKRDACGDCLTPQSSDQKVKLVSRIERNKKLDNHSVVDGVPLLTQSHYHSAQESPNVQIETVQIASPSTQPPIEVPITADVPNPFHPLKENSIVHHLVLEPSIASVVAVDAPSTPPPSTPKVSDSIRRAASMFHRSVKPDAAGDARDNPVESTRKVTYLI